MQTVNYNDDDHDDDNVQDDSPGLCGTHQMFPPQPKACLKLMMMRIMIMIMTVKTMITRIKTAKG